MAQNNLSVQILQGGFSIITPDGDSVSLTFLAAPENSLIGASDGAVVFWAGEGIRATVYADAGIVHLVLFQDDASPKTLAFRVSGGEIVATGAQSLTLGHLNLNVFDGGAQLFSEDVVQLALPASEMRLEFSPSDTFRAFDTAPPAPAPPPSFYAVAAGQRTPTFSLAVFDDHACTRQRPVRLGVPVISTVPAYGTGLSTDDQHYYTTGLGPSSRQMYFLVVAYSAQPLPLAPNLQISMPSGVDTVAIPINVPLTKVVNTSNPNLPLLQLPAGYTFAGQAVYAGSYVFNAEDTVNYVDGFAYLSVYLPLSVQVALPMKLQVSSDGPHAPANTVANIFSVGPAVISESAEPTEEAAPPAETDPPAKGVSTEATEETTEKATEEIVKEVTKEVPEEIKEPPAVEKSAWWKRRGH